MCSHQDHRDAQVLPYIRPNLTVAKTGKYLGVTISDNLSWNAHAGATTKKANNSLAFLARNLASFPKDMKAQGYFTLVRSVLDYSSTLGDPYTNDNIKKLEAVQRRAARFVMRDYKTTSSLSQVIADLGWKSLHQHRVNAKLVMVHRTVYGITDIPALPYLPQAALSTRGHMLCYVIQDAGKNSTGTPFSLQLSDCGINCRKAS